MISIVCTYIWDIWDEGICGYIWYGQVCWLACVISPKPCQFIFGCSISDLIGLIGVASTLQCIRGRCWVVWRVVDRSAAPRCWKDELESLAETKSALHKSCDFARALVVFHGFPCMSSCEWSYSWISSISLSLAGSVSAMQPCVWWYIFIFMIVSHFLSIYLIKSNLIQSNQIL